MTVSISYFEIPVTDLDRAQRFYEHLFATPLEREEIDGYEMALFPEATAGRGTNGALARGDVYVPGKAGPVVYFSVECLDTVLRRLDEIDGVLLYPKKAVGDHGYVAELEDSEGNRIALHQSL